jgi:hypothetical protein
MDKTEALAIGKATNWSCWPQDETLEKIIAYEKIVLAFLEGKGPTWGLATTALRLELESMQKLLEVRQHGMSK